MPNKKEFGKLHRLKQLLMRNLNFHPNPSLSEKHNLVSAKAYILHEEQLKAHALSLKHQYIWLQ